MPSAELTFAALLTRLTELGLVDSTWRTRGLSKSFIRRVLIGVAPFRVLMTLRITYLRSPLRLQVDPKTNL